MTADRIAAAKRAQREAIGATTAAIRDKDLSVRMPSSKDPVVIAIPGLERAVREATHPNGEKKRRVRR